MPIMVEVLGHVALWLCIALMVVVEIRGYLRNRVDLNSVAGLPKHIERCCENPRPHTSVMVRGNDVTYIVSCFACRAPLGSGKSMNKAVKQRNKHIRKRQEDSRKEAEHPMDTVALDAEIKRRMFSENETSIKGESHDV